MIVPRGTNGEPSPPLPRETRLTRVGSADLFLGGLTIIATKALRRGVRFDETREPPRPLSLVVFLTSTFALVSFLARARACRFSIQA